MSRNPNNSNNNDNTATEDFTENPENTMKEELSNSIGMVLLRLKEQYFPDAPDAEMDNQYETCLQAIDTLAQGDTQKASVAELKRRTQEPIDAHLDTVTLYLPHEKKSQQYVFRLKEVLTLVWTALQDDPKFAHHYTGTEAEKLQQANQDRPHRLDSFFSTLDKIKTENICHTGVRNDLVFLLNETYEGVHLIEDARSTVLSFLRENIQAKFWEVYTPEPVNHTTPAIKNPEKEEEEPKKQPLTTALFTWIRKANPQAVLDLVDPKEIILTALHKHFEEHGIQPNNIKLDTLIKEALASLTFSCDPQQYPTLSAINTILNAPDDKDPTVNTALKKMQTWIQNNSPLIEPTDQDTETTTNQSNVRDFECIYTADQTLKKHRLLLTLAGTIAIDLSTTI